MAEGGRGVAEMVSTALRAIHSEISTSGGQSTIPASSIPAIPADPDSAEEFQSPCDGLYRRTVSAFRPQAQSPRSGKRGRGRHRKEVCMKVFLLGKPVSEVPSPKEQRKLTQSGLGSPRIQGSQCIFMKGWNLDDVEEYLLSIYPGVPIDVVGYTFGKSSKLRKITRVEFQNVISLKRQVKKGKLFIIPKTELLAPGPQVHGSSNEILDSPVPGSSNESLDQRSGFRNTSTLGEQLCDVHGSSNEILDSPVPGSSNESLDFRNRSTLGEQLCETDRGPSGSTDTPIVPEEVLPTMRAPRGRSRRRRAAAEFARSQIREWCNREDRASNGGNERGLAVAGPSGTHGMLSDDQRNSSNTESLENESTGNEPSASDNFINTDTPTIQFRRSRPSTLLNGNVTVVRGQQAEVHVPVASFSSSVSHSFEDLIEVIDSEDEELERAIEASLLEAENEATRTEMQMPCTLQGILEVFQRDAVDVSERTELIVFRKQVLQSAFRGLSRQNFKLNAKIYVKFSGEIGQDYGGPRREFFRLAIKELQQSQLFEGEEGNKIFSHNINLLEQNRYKMAGRLVALSLAQEGPGPQFFNEILFHLMVEDGIVIEINQLLQKLKNILPEDMYRIMEELAAVQSCTNREQFLTNHGDWVVDQGISNIYRLSIENKEDYFRLLVKQYLYYRTSSEIHQFLNGMDEVASCWQLIKKSSSLFKDLFCHQPRALTKSQVENLYTINYSEEGSNKRAMEDQTIYAWELFLQDINEGSVSVSFEDLLGFITGADRIPPCGFSSQITINFFEMEQGIKRLPYASTCSLELYLPRGISDPDILKENLVVALSGSLGFEKI